EQTSVESPASVAVTEDSSVGTITTPPAPPSSLTADPTPGGAVSNDESTTQIIPESSVSDSACIPADQSLSTSVVTDEITNPINVEPSTSVSSVPAPAYVSSSSSAPASVSSSSSAPASVLSSLAPTSVSSSSSASPSVPSVAADKISEQKDTGLAGEDGEESSVPLEDRVARARKLAELKKQQREQEQFQKDHEEEIRRRQMGKSIHQMKQEQEEKELKDLAAERKKDKEMDRLAREKVKAQIAADRAEREERNALLRGNVPASPAPAAPPSASGSSSSSSATSCRLKLRLPDGSSELARFEPSVMLSEVRQHVQQNIKLPFTRFKLVSSVHQRPFTDQDMNTSLADLGLAPSAIVLVMPSNIGSGKNDGGSGVVSVSTSWLESLMWLIMLPVNAVMSIVSSFFGGATQGTQSQASTSETSGGAAPEPGAGNTRRAAE
ncbi:UBX domain, partial [Trinorchestia longiramus]